MKIFRILYIITETLFLPIHVVKFIVERLVSLYTLVLFGYEHQANRTIENTYKKLHKLESIKANITNILNN